MSSGSANRRSASSASSTEVPRPPSRAAPRLRAVQPAAVSPRAAAGVSDHAIPDAPFQVRSEPLRSSALDGQHVALAGAEVPAFGEARPVVAQPLGQQHVAIERLEHVLPRADGGRVADDAAILPAAVRATRSGTSRSAAQSPPPITLPARAVATPTPCRRSSGRRYDARYDAVTSSAQPLLLLVGIVAAERVVLAVAPDPLAVLVALVAGDDDDGAHASAAGAPLRARSTVPMTLVA